MVRKVVDTDDKRIYYSGKMVKWQLKYAALLLILISIVFRSRRDEKMADLGI